MPQIKYPEWTRIPWDGNPDLKQECWRKSFGRGHVSVGIGGEFRLVSFSFGANHDSSHSGTRWNYDNPSITEEDMMKGLDEYWSQEQGRRDFSTPPWLHKKPADWDEKQKQKQSHEKDTRG
jgi:hypothetical protein